MMCTTPLLARTSAWMTVAESLMTTWSSTMAMATVCPSFSVGTSAGAKAITSSAEKEEAIIRGQADAEAVRIYAEAYSQDEDFYAFVKSLETLKEALNDKTRLIISTKSPLYKYLKEMR